MIKQKTLQEHFSYNPGTGVFTWITGRNKGKQAGCYVKDGYSYLRFNGKNTLMHRAAWIYVNGDVLIKGDRHNTVDHKNRDKHDNRIGNLRYDTHSTNMLNIGDHPLNTSGHKGIKKRINQSGNSYYEIRVSRNGVRRNAVTKTLEEALTKRELLRV